VLTSLEEVGISLGKLCILSDGVVGLNPIERRLNIEEISLG
jgi:hypothetical protein